MERIFVVGFSGQSLSLSRIAGILLGCLILFALPLKASADEGPPAGSGGRPPADTAAGPAEAGTEEDGGKAGVDSGEGKDPAAVLLEEGRRDAASAVEDAHPAPALPEIEGGWSLLLEFGKIVCLLIALCGMAFVVVRVFGPKVGAAAFRPGDRIRVIEERRLCPKTTLYLVDVAGQPMLLGVSDRRIETIASGTLDRTALEREVPPQDPASTSRSPFASLIRRKRGGSNTSTQGEGKTS